MREIEVKLERLRFYARHGVYDHELRDGNEFEVTLSVRYQAPDVTDDRMEETISYVELFEIVKAEMSIPRKLLETVAASIVKTIEQHHPEATAVECSITKLAPPIASMIGQATVTVRKADKS